ncbi:MAG: NFACT RNA binding domain-containing protein [archaeon]|nr:NFACT RNA binding domain-containing protein [archaeon]MCR4323371.1 NFACT RNA binding domain-containing protein [Nanoarchaeota archaeon]
MTNYRKYTLSTGKIIFGGRDAENNDELVKSAKRNETLLHTEAPGSPFVNAGESPTKKEIQEAAIFCARHSQDWRDNKRDINVNIFLRADMKKGLLMKKGTWSVKKQSKLKVKKADIQKLTNETN